MTLSNLLRTILLTVAVVTRVTAATPPIALDIRYRVAPAPGYFKAKLTIEPNEANRYACLYATPMTAQGDTISHCWQLDGEAAPRTHWSELKNLPAGRYDVVASVIRKDESSKLSTHLSITVTGLGYEPDTDTP